MLKFAYTLCNNERLLAEKKKKKLSESLPESVKKKNCVINEIVWIVELLGY